MERVGVNAIGKQHFTALYSPARELSFTRRNVLAGWSKCVDLIKETFTRDTSKGFAQVGVLGVGTYNEIMLIHDEGGMTMQARIIPSFARSGRPRAKLMAYERSLDDLGDLPHVITETGTLMGLREFGRTQGAEFAANAQLDCYRPTRLDLGHKCRTGGRRHDLVDSYVQNIRAIILAVVQASNDIANQSIIQKSKRFDQTGGRTVGIITKPDLVNIGTEGRVAALSKNQDEMRLILGFFLPKNPSPSELSELSNHLLGEQNEENFFARSPWNQHQLHKEKLGASNLRGSLQQLLDNHIGRELPKVREEIRTLLRKVDRELSDGA
ncbi:hypothetical protein D0869_05340 [Hortaea werneckii]|uniref:Uncharacterized protein n=1 Tax=Hortaea werneckii TaxID=91943 RepID=A0A3M6WXY8_HORWE|nr:hypothetical protein D0869_05340 [Hortaea werneckii]